MGNTDFSKYRWVIVTLLFSGLTGLNILWFIPSPLLTVIMDDLNMNLMQGGLGMSIVCLMVAMFAIAGGWLINKTGVKKTFLAGLWLMAAGAGCTWLIDTFQGLLLTRILIGIGFGLCMPVSGVTIMHWFPETERPYMNTINSALPYAATIIIFSFTIPLYHLLSGSWRMTIAVWGIFFGVIALCYGFLGKEKAGREDMKENKFPAESFPEKHIYFSIWKNREVILLSIAEACDMWGFQFLASMLPTFFTAEAGLSMSMSSGLMAIFPISGVVAGFSCGIWMGKVGLRRPFTWPMHLAIFCGTIMAVTGSGWLRITGIVLAGFGNAGWAPALFTMPMEFEDMTPARVGAVYSTMLSTGFLAAFISPWLGGWIAQKIGLLATFFLFSFASLVAAFCTFMMKETGPAARKGRAEAFRKSVIKGPTPVCK